MVFTFIATSFCLAVMNFVLFDFPLFIKFRSFSATVCHICDMMLAWWCMLDVEKSIFWSERAYVHIFQWCWIVLWIKTLPDIIKCNAAIIIIIVVVMSIFLERLTMWNLLNCAEQEQIQKYKTHAYKTHKTVGVQIMLKHPTKHKKEYPLLRIRIIKNY